MILRIVTTQTCLRIIRCKKRTTTPRNLGYYFDRFIPAFIHACNSEKPYHRDPEINRGYWARTSAITSMVVQFVEFAELDFSSVTAKKISNQAKSDLRQIREFDGKLATADLDFSQPTLVIAECVFVYMDEAHSHELIEEVAKRFETVAVLNYEQVNMTDTFSKVMSTNLSSRGIHLPGLPTCKSLQTQKQRFLNVGFPHVQACWTISEIYSQHLQRQEVSKIESLEPLDEKELLTQLLEHYCLVMRLKTRPK
ncbi:hypothetical protein niasHT_035893 [Heterodera trifolii]|uniref:Leucine carboxyl methyltransferase 1 n=1 Tax=Heterodera trifolii TaxID=157864 RepID=A0ABD2IHM3_9BILA